MMRNRSLLTFALLLFAADAASAQEASQMQQIMMGIDTSIDVSEVRTCDPRNPASWREAQTVEGVEIAEDPSCAPDMPELVAAAVKGTNNISTETLNATGLSPDAVVKGADLDGDGDPDEITIKLEIVGLNEGIDSITPFEIAPGVDPAFWTFAPKSTGMATENMSASHLMRMPSPPIRIEVGDEVELVVENTHYLPHTVHLHGVDHPYVDSEGEGNDGVPQTSEKPIMPGESRTYNINPRVAGTMAYHCHVQPDVHVLMGLNGMFIVEENRPNNPLQTINLGAGKVRHPSVTSREQYDGEFDLHYQDVDKELHELMKGTNDPARVAKLTNRAYDVTERTPDYFLLNGRSFPYTLWDSQIIVDPGSEYYLRVFNIGAESVALHTHGHKVLVEALDGIDLPEGTEYYRDVVDIHVAQRVDMVLNTRDDGLNSYGEGIWLFHDHHEAHVTTDGISPGGDISMITYRSFLGERGMPDTQGVDLRTFFTPEFYEKKVPIWDSYDPDGMFRMRMEDVGKVVGGDAKTGMTLTLSVIGLVLGGGVAYLFARRNNRKRSENGLSGGSVAVRTLFGSTVILLALLALLMFPVLAAAQSHAEMEGIDGIHIMADGSVMLGNGETLDDATINAEGDIVLGSGEVVEPLMDMRSSDANDGSQSMDGMEEMDPESENTQDSEVAAPPAQETGADEVADTDENDSIEGMVDMDMSENETFGETSHAEMEGIDGIHIMPNGRVMTGTGLWVADAEVTPEGAIVLGSGERVEPVMDMRGGEGIRRTENTMVVNENTDRLPLGCTEIAGEQHITVEAGVEHAKQFPGTAFTYDHQSFENIEPCTLLTVTFENKDNIRHQFMVHDLPSDIYPMGMFNIEVTGPGEETGTFITPADPDTLMVHCGVPEHEAKGMKAQIKNGGGDGDLPNIPGITGSDGNDGGRGASSSTYALFGWGVGAFLFGYFVVYLLQKRRVLV